MPKDPSLITDPSQPLDTAMRAPTPTTGDNPQMDPGQFDFRHYTFTDRTGAVVANVIVPKLNGTLAGVSYARGTEYWSRVSPTLPVDRIIVTWADYSWAQSPSLNLGPASFRMNQAPAWTGQMPAPSARSFVGSNLVIVWSLSLNAAGGWSGHLTWFNTTGQNNVFSNASSGMQLEAGAPINTRSLWYSTSVAPQ